MHITVTPWQGTLNNDMYNALMITTRQKYYLLLYEFWLFNRINVVQERILGLSVPNIIDAYEFMRGMVPIVYFLSAIYLVVSLVCSTI